jgi:hypothetical protein
MKLFVSPHNDDAALFGNFTLQRERPVVLTVFDSHLQWARGHSDCCVGVRRQEDFDALVTILGCRLRFGGIFDDDPEPWAAIVTLLTEFRADGVDEVWIPAIEDGGHAQHNLVGEIGQQVFQGLTIHRYLTYTEKGKSTGGRLVPYNGKMLRKKLMSLVCYKTQIEIDALGCAEHFARDQREYSL